MMTLLADVDTQRRKACGIEVERSRNVIFCVMPALVAGIHVLTALH